MTIKLAAVTPAILLLISSVLSAQDFQWGAASKGKHVDGGNAVCMDAEGNSYTAGSFSSPVVSLGTSSLMNTSKSAGPEPATDAFVAKFDAKGNVVWAFQTTGDGIERSVDIACDSSGHVAWAGIVKGKSMRVGDKELVNPTTSSFSTFIVRLNALGKVQWAQIAGGKTETRVESVATGPDGEVYMTGSFAQGVTFGGYEYKSKSGNNSSVFIAKYDKNGLLKWFEQVWGTRPGGQNSSQAGKAIFATGDSRFVYVAGWFRGRSNFGDTKSIVSNTEPSPSGMRPNFFLAKYDSDGNIIWVEQVGSKQINASMEPEITDIVVGSDNGVYMTGFSPGVLMFGGTEIRGVPSRNGWNYDIFLAKYDPDGKALWHRMAGGSESDKAWAIAATTGGVAIAGVVSSLDARFGTRAMPRGQGQSFVALYDHDGSMSGLLAAKSGLPNNAMGLASNGPKLAMTGNFMATGITLGKIALKGAGVQSFYAAGINSPAAGAVGRTISVESGVAGRGGHEIPLVLNARENGYRIVGSGPDRRLEVGEIRDPRDGQPLRGRHRLEADGCQQPVLANIPYLQMMFNRGRATKEYNTCLIFVTPRIIIQEE